MIDKKYIGFYDVIKDNTIKFKDDIKSNEIIEFERMLEIIRKRSLKGYTFYTWSRREINIDVEELKKLFKTIDKRFEIKGSYTDPFITIKWVK